MKMIPEVGDVVKVKSYCYTNRHGGTEIVENEIVECRIVKAWYDEECGWRYWATPSDPYLLSRKDAHTPSKEDIIYVDQFDMIGN
jgi:hypothetical protein